MGVATQPAEWLPARVVLLCEPNIETLFAILQTDSANFLYPFSLGRARAEHQAYRRALEAAGVQVIELRDALAGAAFSPQVDEEARDRLRRWAREAIVVDVDAAIPSDEYNLLQQHLTRTLAALDAYALADLLLLRPTLHIAYQSAALDPTTRYHTRFEVSPIHNAYYTRDPLMTTPRGCVIGRLRLPAREPENDIAAYVLEQLGIQPLYRVQAPGTLEGGDFIPCGDFVLQGMGLLTNEDGVRQCLDQRVYGDVEVAVVEDPRGGMDEMHLDTYFAMLDRHLATVCDYRLSGFDEPIVLVYMPESTPDAYTYRLARKTRLSTYLSDKGVQVVPFSKEEQANFAPNGLLTGPRQFIGVNKAGESFERRLQAAGVQTTFLDFDALTGGYGGPHCSSQVLVRGEIRN
jgi:arginine deiminase